MTGHHGRGRRGGAVKPVVRLLGDDAAVRAVGREAVSALRACGPETELFPRLWQLHLHRQRALVASAPAGPAGTAEVKPPALPFRIVWSVLVGIGQVAALTTVVMFGPVGRKNAFLLPETASAVASVAAMIAIPALLIALVTVPRNWFSVKVAAITGVVVGLLCTALTVFRLIAGTGDDRGFSADQLAAWIPGTVVTLLLLGGLALRCELAGPRQPTVQRSTGSSAMVATNLHRTAATIAATPAGEVARGRWDARLDVLDRRGIDPGTVTQARTMSPVEWLAWLAYDGEIEISGVIPRR